MSKESYLSIVEAMLEEDVTADVTQMFYLDSNSFGARWMPVNPSWYAKFNPTKAILGVDRDFLKLFAPNWFGVRRQHPRTPLVAVANAVTELRKMGIYGLVVDVEYVVTQTLGFFDEIDAIVAGPVVDGCLDR